jgi:hypothetical protein
VNTNFVLIVKQMIGECDTGSTWKALDEVTAVSKQEGAVFAG